jgi:hypothetical protein
MPVSIQHVLGEKSEELYGGTVRFILLLCSWILAQVHYFRFRHKDNSSLRDWGSTNVAPGVREKVLLGHLPGDVDVPRSARLKLCMDQLDEIVPQRLSKKQSLLVCLPEICSDGELPRLPDRFDDELAVTWN